MRRYILKRLLLMIPTLFGVAVLIFFLLRVLPGDIVELKYAGTGFYAPKEALARERAQLGLDQPIWKQFVTWIVGIPRLDFGTSMWTGQPITHEIAIRLAFESGGGWYCHTTAGLSLGQPPVLSSAEGSTELAQYGRGSGTGQRERRSMSLCSRATRNRWRSIIRASGEVRY
jgi:ABC-type microcin C transport system permease subunit YejB